MTVDPTSEPWTGNFFRFNNWSDYKNIGYFVLLGIFYLPTCVDFGYKYPFVEGRLNFSWEYDMGYNNVVVPLNIGLKHFLYPFLLWKSRGTLHPWIDNHLSITLNFFCSLGCTRIITYCSSIMPFDLAWSLSFNSLSMDEGILDSHQCLHYSNWHFHFCFIHTLARVCIYI